MFFGLFPDFLETFPGSQAGHFRDFFPDFLETFSGSLDGGPGRHFRDFFGISGPEGPRDPCKGRAGSQDLDPEENRERKRQNISRRPGIEALTSELPTGVAAVYGPLYKKKTFSFLTQRRERPKIEKSKNIRDGKRIHKTHLA